MQDNVQKIMFMVRAVSYPKNIFHQRNKNSHIISSILCSSLMQEQFFQPAYNDSINTMHYCPLQGFARHLRSLAFRREYNAILYPIEVQAAFTPSGVSLR